MKLEHIKEGNPRYSAIYNNTFTEVYDVGNELWLILFECVNRDALVWVNKFFKPPYAVATSVYFEGMGISVYDIPYTSIGYTEAIHINQIIDQINAENTTP